MHPTTRFSNRVENYIRYRPSYPDGVFDVLAKHAGLTQPSLIADVGSGTGISAELFLKRGHSVFGVEPNREMREAAERLLAQYSKFHSVNGTAEQTALDEGSVDYIVAAQAYHWFDREKTRTEFARILRPSGWCVILWNSRRLDSTPFLREYERLLNQYSSDYSDVQHKNIEQDQLRAWFRPGTYQYHCLYNEQRFDWDGFVGRVLSSSYCPVEGDPQHEPLMNGLRDAFQKYQEHGQVCFEYDTEIHLGKVN